MSRPNIELWGTYTAGPAGNWNAGSAATASSTTNDDWYAGLQNFGIATGVQPNATNCFPCYGGMTSWPYNLQWELQGIAIKYGAANFVPVISLKMFSVNVAADGNYAFNDSSGAAKKDVIAGKWDAVLKQYVQFIAGAGFKYALVRMAYEANFQFMQDSINWDTTSQLLWRQAMAHCYSVMNTQAAALGITLDCGVCIASGSGGAPISAMMDANLAAQCSVMFVDIYNGDYRNSITTVANRIAAWQNQDGVAGMTQCIALATKYGLPMMFAESGTGPKVNVSPNDDPAWTPWLISQIQAIQTIAKLPFFGMVWWNINPSDGSWQITGGKQPTVLAAVVANLAGGKDLLGSFSAPAVVVPPPPAGMTSIILSMQT